MHYSLNFSVTCSACAWKHYENMPIQYTEIFKVVKNEIFCRKKNDIFLYLLKTDCGHTLEPPRRSMFWSKIRKIGIPLQTPFLLYKSGGEGSVYFTDMFS